MKKIILFSFFIFSFCAILSAQIPASKVTDAHIVGDVTDAHSGDHLPYVNVVIKGTTIGIMTDASGHYFLKNLLVFEIFQAKKHHLDPFLQYIFLWR